jgi:hypothetical protein
MGQAIPSQHPAVVSRAQFNKLRNLLAVALIAVIGLTVAVVILAGDDDGIPDTSPAPALGQLNYGGYNPAVGRPQPAPPTTAVEGARGSVKDYSQNSATGDYDSAPAPSPNTRLDGGLEEGARSPGFRTH